METIFLMGLVLGALATAHRWRRSRRALPPPEPRPLQPGDVLQVRGEDLLLWQVSRLGEAGRARSLGWVGGGRVIFSRNPEPPEPDDAVWLLHAATVEAAGSELVEHGGLRYRLGARYPIEAVVHLLGLGAPSLAADPLPPDLCRALEYRGVGAARLLVLLREGGGALAFAGEALPAREHALLPSVV